MGRIDDSVWRWSMEDILRQPVAVLRAEFWVVSIFMSLEEAALGYHIGAA